MKKLCLAVFVLVLLFSTPFPASAVPMQLSATYSIAGGGYSIDENWSYADGIYLTYNAYYDSDMVITTLGNYELGFQGLNQSVSLYYWEMLYLNEVIVKSSGGSFVNYTDPTVTGYINSNGGLTWAEMPCLACAGGLDLRSNSSATIGMDLYTWAENTKIGNIVGNSGYGNITVKKIPEPTALCLLFGAFLGLGILTRKKVMKMPPMFRWEIIKG